MDREKLYRLLRLGIEKGASDIHFQVGYLPLYRFNGDLVELRYKVLTAQDTEEIVKLLIEGEPELVDRNFNEADLAFEPSPHLESSIVLDEVPDVLPQHELERSGRRRVAPPHEGAGRRCTAPRSSHTSDRRR